MFRISTDTSTREDWEESFQKLTGNANGHDLNRIEYSAQDRIHTDRVICFAEAAVPILQLLEETAWTSQLGNSSP